MVGSLGATSLSFDKHHREIPGKYNSTVLIKSALLTWSNILHRVLDSKDLCRIRHQFTKAVTKRDNNNSKSNNDGNNNNYCHNTSNKNSNNDDDDNNNNNIYYYYYDNFNNSNGINDGNDKNNTNGINNKSY